MKTISIIIKCIKKESTTQVKDGEYFCAFLSKILFWAAGGGTRGLNKTREGVDS